MIVCFIHIRKKHLFPLLLFILFALSASLSIAQKNDTLYLLNGDRISGEIKQYKYGFLTYKTYGVSTVKVKYDKIATFYSDKKYDILLEDGNRRYGSFDTSYLQQFVKIITINDTVLTPLIEIVNIDPINQRFWDRIDGSVDIGFSYTKANTLSQLTLNSDIRYRQKKYFTLIDLNSINSIQSNTEDSRTKKNDLSVAYYRLLRRSWYAVGSGATEQNTQLGLELRLQGGLGMANEIIHTNTNNLLGLLGVTINREWSSDTTIARTNAEIYAALNYRLFRFSDPEIDITSSFAAFPSLTVANRWRINYDIKFKIEIISDMYFSFSFYTAYDNKPTSDISDEVDYSFSTSFGYSF